ncbi:PAS domain-containing hybrid sensor histidine kinase/response regulator [Alkalispirochaeta alkalica]|uniref:PAS domain-containing hybrid sensor histidine kinase/response regulator n=1 Tax=Alkalispirochaeta alkalica TaxID=46356 RepID=UPI000380B58D|nr:response regulator [Alkalispirochaeta alkalica]
MTDLLKSFAPLDPRLLCVTDASGTILEANQGWLRLLDIPPEEVRGRHYREFIFPDDRLQAEQTFRNMMEPPRPSPEDPPGNSPEEIPQRCILRLQAADGSLRFCQWRSFCKGDRYYISLEDISERYVAERHLRENEQHFLSLTENIPGAIFRIRFSGPRGLSFMSGKVQALTGYTAGELLQADPGEQALIHPEDLPRITGEREHARTRQIAHHEDHHYTTEYRILHKSGDLRWVCESGFVWYSPLGQEWFIDGLMIDITDRKRAEEKLTSYVEQTELQNLRLEMARREAEAATRAKSEFISNMSHELRTPLNGIMGFADLLADTPLGEDQLQYLGYLQNSSRSLLKIISQILEFVRLDGSLQGEETEPRPERIDTLSFFDSVTDSVLHPAQEKGLELILRIAPEVPASVVADETKALNILVHLLGNAVKFTDRGEIEISVGYTPREESALPDDEPDTVGFLHIRVRDTGAGIPEEKRRNLFKPFFQTDSSSTRKHEGLGLGLAIADRLARTVGPGISVESTQSGGSEFSFPLRCHEAGPPPALPELSHLHRAYLSDSSPAALRVLEEYLTRAGISPEIETSPDAALEYWSTPDRRGPGEPDLIFLPVATARELLQKPGFASRFGQRLVLLPPALEMTRTSLEIQENPPGGVLPKPVRLAVLGEILQKLDVPRNAPPEEDSLPDQGRDQDRKKPLVMIVENDETNLLLMQTQVDTIMPSAEILSCRTGAEAIHAVRFVEPAVILMDIAMPGMNGREATRQIRSRSRGATVPVIAVTAGITAGQREECLQAGMNDVLAKPLDSATLRACLARWLPPDIAP